jgi:predicted Kef-type K+ transport protein
MTVSVSKALRSEFAFVIETLATDLDGWEEIGIDRGVIVGLTAAHIRPLLEKLRSDYGPDGIDVPPQRAKAMLALAKRIEDEWSGE